MQYAVEEAKSLEGGTMPNGYKYEEHPLENYKEWRLRELRREDADNGDPSMS